MKRPDVVDPRGDEEEDDSLAGILALHLKWPDLAHLHSARDVGLKDDLAAHIEDGGELHPETRRWLAQFLRGEAPQLRPGIKRTGAQVQADWDMLSAIRDIQTRDGVSENRAIDLYLARHPKLKRDTVRSKIRRLREGMRAASGAS